MDSEEQDAIIIKVKEKDNVGIVPAVGGYQKDTVLVDGTILLEDVPMGHKVALCEIEKGESVIRYGEQIGTADRQIQKGEWVNEHKISLPTLSKLKEKKIQPGSGTDTEKPLVGYTFKGYKNPDGSVGTKNLLAITTSVQCVAGMTEYVAKKVREELLPKYPNVDGVITLTHEYGCGVAINTPEAAIPIRTIKNLTQNPNFGSEVLVVGLGCEKLRPEWLLDNDRQTPSSNILYMQDEAFYGFSAMVDGFMEMAEKRLIKLNNRERETCSASNLVVGMQCGGSDTFSGLTGNPAAGYASDLIVRAGGSVMFSEVTEVMDAIHLLLPRASGKKVQDALIREMQWYNDYLARGNSDSSSNPSPGNKKGGLSNVVEKALGSIAKSGDSPIKDVIGPGERIQKKGLTFAATPASDFVCGTLQLAAGMNLHVFITGRGTPYGLEAVPVIKIGTNSKLSERWHDLIDLDAGPIALGKKTVEEVGWELFHLMLEVASGEKTVAADQLGLHNDLSLFNPGPLT